MKQIAIPFIVLAFLFTGCKNEVEETVTGMWTIDTLNYKGHVLSDCLESNVIFFKVNEPSIFPATVNDCGGEIGNFNATRDWEIKKSPNQLDSIELYLKISDKGGVFNGTHNVAFHADSSEKLLKMEIWSDSLYILCRKGLFNYDKNHQTVKRLTRINRKKKTI